MKKGIITLFILSCINLFANEYQNNLSTIHTRVNLNRGEEQFRSNVIFTEFGLNGRSNSNQYVDYLGYSSGKQKPQDMEYAKTKSFLLGTNSNLVKNPRVFAGIALGHFKSNLDKNEENYKVRTIGFNYFVGYNYNKTLFISKVGYSKSKNTSKNEGYKSSELIIGGEVGHIYRVKDKTTIYPFATLELDHHQIKAHDNIPKFKNNIPVGGVGVNLLSVINEKLLVNTTAKWNYKLKKDRYYLDNNTTEIVPRSYGEISVQLGYFVDTDFLINLGYKYLFNKNYNFNLVSLGLSHNF